MNISPLVVWNCSKNILSLLQLPCLGCSLLSSSWPYSDSRWVDAQFTCYGNMCNSRPNSITSSGYIHAAMQSINAVLLLDIKALSRVLVSSHTVGSLDFARGTQLERRLIFILLLALKVFWGFSHPFWMNRAGLIAFIFTWSSNLKTIHQDNDLYTMSTENSKFRSAGRCGLTL